MLSACVCRCRQSQPADLDAFADHLTSNYVPNTVIIDATASDIHPAKYLQRMQKGIHIITPNKKLNSGPLERYQALRQFQRGSYIHFLYEVLALPARHIATTSMHGSLLMMPTIISQFVRAARL